MLPLLVVNPRSGGGRTGALFEQMRGPVEAALGAFDVALTERPRHAVDLAREAALAGRETVIAVGGDGSIHEVVNGLMQARDRGAGKTRLGVLGAGTGGDFRKSLGIEHRLDRYLAAIAGGKTRRIDVARLAYTTHAGEREAGFFVNILSVGLGGLVDRYVAEAGRTLGGTAAYFLASAKALLESEVGVVACTFHLGETVEQQELSTRNLALCNGRFFGSGMEVAPMAKLDDGVLEVVDLGAAPRLKFALASSRIYKGEHLKSPDVKHFRCDKAKLELLNRGVNARFLLDVDGEPLGTLPIEVELVNRALEVFVP
ncbi:MAG TPA: diacylglycerol kinase family protein [Minicystis sp.]|nr:diacylglycerol kinase family protein [Minicystis sp.]